MSGAARSGVFSLGLANALALLAAVAAASLYARWLDAAQFAHWATAMALARAGLLLLDGGLKTALVRRAAEPDAGSLRWLSLLCAAVAGVLTAAIALVVWLLWTNGRISAGQATLYFAYPAAYLLSYPPLFGALARLERAQRFGPVGRAEGLSVTLEFALPAALMSIGTPYWAAFAAAAVLARLVRSAWIAGAARGVAQTCSVPAFVRPGELLKEGAGVQAVAGLSMIRDQMHLWLLAPWFGASWAGLYTFAYTACMIVSQVGVQTASRVALPALRAMEPAARWPSVLAQVRLLAIITLPPLALLPAWLARADALWWGGRWHEAVAIAAWVAVRMVAGVATTTLGAWLMVARSPWANSQAHALWTAFEIVLALLALIVLGPIGLAVSGAVAAWAGVVLFIAAAAPRESGQARLLALVSTLTLRPSAWAALALGSWVHFEPSALPLATLALPLCWLAEPLVRQRIWVRQLPHERA